MAAHRIASSGRVARLKLAGSDLAAPRRHNFDARRHSDVDTAAYLEWLCDIATDDLIALVRARLEEDEGPEPWSDDRITAATVSCSQQSRLLH
jgi:hypothetical protein